MNECRLSFNVDAPLEIGYKPEREVFEYSKSLRDRHDARARPQRPLVYTADAEDVHAAVPQWQAVIFWLEMETLLRNAENYLVYEGWPDETTTRLIAEQEALERELYSMLSDPYMGVYCKLHYWRVNSFGDAVCD